MPTSRADLLFYLRSTLHVCVRICVTGRGIKSIMSLSQNCLSRVDIPLPSASILNVADVKSKELKFSPTTSEQQLFPVNLGAFVKLHTPPTARLISSSGFSGGHKRRKGRWWYIEQQLIKKRSAKVQRKIRCARVFPHRYCKQGRGLPRQLQSSCCK